MWGPRHPCKDLAYNLRKIKKPREDPEQLRDMIESTLLSKDDSHCQVDSDPYTGRG